MNWKFWRKIAKDGYANQKPFRNSKPRELPEKIGRKMVVEMKIDPDLVWSLKYVNRPMDETRKIKEFSLYSPEKAKQAGVVIKDWMSLENHPELVLYTGRHYQGDDSIEIKQL
jgi:hypothetical protein